MAKDGRYFPFIVPLYTTRTVWCTKASNEGWNPDAANDSRSRFHFKCPCLHLRGIMLSLSPVKS